MFFCLISNQLRCFYSTLAILFSTLIITGSAFADLSGVGLIGERKGSTTVVVFVHGLTGNASDTWTNRDNGNYWPDMLKQQDLFKNIDIFVYEYPSSLLSSSDLSTPQLSQDLYQFLDTNNIDYSKNIIFIAHSLGGIIVRNFIVTYRRYLSSVVSVHLYGTPTNGSDLVNFTKYIPTSPQVENMKPLEKNALLLQIRLSWKEIENERPQFLPRVYCAYETENYRYKSWNPKIVSQSSATSLCNHEYAIKTDHEDIVKPDNLQHRSNVFFINSYKKSITNLDECRQFRDSNSEKRAWEATSKSNINEIMKFMKDYPCSIYLPIAEWNLNKLSEERRIISAPSPIHSAGMFIDFVSANEAVDQPAGSKVKVIAPNSPAERAGLSVNDIIVAVADKPVKSDDDVTSGIGTTAYNKSVKLTVWNSSDVRTVEIDTFQ